uniref:MICOS complex subunit n=1 Tax=Lygus hesperus TaxID=30085 RepID=A0A0A9XSM4_LYGHE
MYTRTFVKGLLLPSIGVGVVHAKGEQDKEDCDDSKKLIRARDLPLYVEPPKCVTCSNKIDNDDGFLITTIRCARQEFQQIVGQARIIQTEAQNLAEEVRRETEDIVSYLRQEENLLPRLGAIGLGGFAGYLLACRKGLIKKTLYSTAGASLIAAVAYPNQAKEYTEEVMCEVKKYAVIGYHFLNGVSRDITGYQLPALSIGHLNISDRAHPPPDAVPSTAHLLPPVVTPTHIPLPGEDPHEAKHHK